LSSRPGRQAGQRCIDARQRTLAPEQLQRHIDRR